MIPFLSVVAACIPTLIARQEPSPYSVAESLRRRPDAVVDLRTSDGMRLLGAQWRYHDAAIIEVDHRLPGADLKASGERSRTHDIEPRAGRAEFDDGAWPIVAPESLEARRTTGKLAFGWFRTVITVPEKIGSISTNGATLVLEIVTDDFCEVWAGGRLSQVLGERSGYSGGWNAPNRTVLRTSASPGEKIPIAVFAGNGPLSAPPDNFVWIRSASIELFNGAKAAVSAPALTEILRADPALDEVLEPHAQFERLAGGFLFTEGPAWHPDGYLLFSDPNANTIYRWAPDGLLSQFRSKTGYQGLDIGEYGQPGSNGLTFDRDGRLTICEHGNRRVVRLEKNGVVTVLADRFEGRRLNSPNDLTFRSDGALYFTDPPFGFPNAYEDKRREQSDFGIYCLKDGKLSRVAAELRGPNGLAFSPDERTLYVTNWDEKRKVVMSYECAPDGSLSGGRVFFDMTSTPGPIALDGIKVDQAGNLYVCGPGGLWILSPSGKHLGTVRGPELPANITWGDEDNRTLYATARTGLYRLRCRIPGFRSRSGP